MAVFGQIVETIPSDFTYVENSSTLSGVLRYRTRAVAPSR